MWEFSWQGANTLSGSRVRGLRASRLGQHIVRVQVHRAKGKQIRSIEVFGDRCEHHSL